MYYLKALLVASMALFFTLVAFTNVVDYNTNWLFVKHVLSMDTTFRSPHLIGRAISSGLLQRSVYVLIIFWEILVAILCWLGTYYLLRKKKKFAVIGLSAGFVLYFLGFCVIASEWFAMWESPHWNGQIKAYLFSAILLLILVFVNQNEKNG